MDRPRCPGEARIRAGVRAGRRVPGPREAHLAGEFRQPEAGLGFDRSPVAHKWRTMIWPNNFL